MKRVFRLPFATRVKTDAAVFVKSIRRDEKARVGERAIKFRAEKRARAETEIAAPFAAVAADIEKRQAGAGVEIYVVGVGVVNIRADF